MKYKEGYYSIFSRTCAKNPSNIAIRHYNGEKYKTYTYSELYGVCEYIYQILQNISHSKGVIGILAERNIIIPSIIAAAHKCKSTFMFLNPHQNINHIAKTLQFTVIITVNNNADTITDLFRRQPDKTITLFDLTINFYTLDFKLKSNLKMETEPSFITMTSGSTGDPKHIQVPMKSIQPNIDDLTKMFNMSSQDIIYFSTPLTFDPSMIEIILASMVGASLLIAPEKPEVLFPSNTTHSITFWQTTPSKFFQHTNHNIKYKFLSHNSTLRVLALGGEPLCGVGRLRELKHVENKTKIYTLYGVSEMSCWACIAELDVSKVITDEDIPLGNCLSETQLQVHEKKNKIGNIVLMSKSRKCVILNKSTGNDECHTLKFIDTGDIGEVKDGIVYYRGRKDDVIKRFGHKVNLKMIELTIMKCPNVRNCSCIWLPKPALIVVYFSADSLSSQELMDFLKCKLDDKHWPDKVLRVDSLPTNFHGKTSKPILTKMYEKKELRTPNSVNSLQNIFLHELKNILNMDCNYDDIKAQNFFDLGGTSFSALAMCNKLTATCPQFSKFILPQLLSQTGSIDEIFELAVKKTCPAEWKPKKRAKRTSSVPVKDSETITCKANNPPVEFVIAWSYDTGKCVDASPTLHHTDTYHFVTVGSHSGKIIVFDAVKRYPRGTLSLNSRVEAPVCCFVHEGCSYGVVGAHDGTVICYELMMCKEIWRINIGAMVKSRATLVNGNIYVAAYDGKLRCLNIKDGLVKSVISVEEQPISADLASAKDAFILLGSLSGACASVQARTGAVAWRALLTAPVFAAPAVFDSDKYVIVADVNGEIQCRTVEKGITIWTYNVAKGNIFSSMYIREDGLLKWQVIFGCHDHRVYSFSIKNYQPALLWKTELSAPVYATPCRLNDSLFAAASNNGKIYVMGSENGIIISEYQLPNETFSSPASYGNYIFIGCRDDRVYSIKYISS